MVLISKKLILLFILLAVLLIPNSLATRNHFNYGNIGLKDVESGNKPLAFASYTPSNHNVSSPFSCQIGVAAKFAPVVEDLDNDGDKELIVATTSDEIRIYDFSCALIQIINFGEDINSMPVLRNVEDDFNETDEFINIIVHGDTIISWYGWSESLNKVVLIDFTPTSGINEFGLSCEFRSLEDLPGTTVCLTINGSVKAVRYSLVSGEILSAVISTGGDLLTKPIPFQSYASSDFEIPDIPNIAVPEKDFTTGFRSKIINFEQAPTSCVHNAGGVAVSDIMFHEEFASFGSSSADSLFVSGHFISSGISRRFFSICDITGTQRLSSGFSTQGNITNWAVVDFNGNGETEACLIYHNATTNSAHVGCWNNRYLRIFDKAINVSNNYRGFAIADFDDSNDIMEFVTNTGIFRYDVASDAFTLINNISSSVVFGDGAIIVTESDTSRVNFGIYTETARIVIFGFLAQAEVACGDGVCSGGENAFNCALDCTINVTELLIEGLIANADSCVNDSQCLSGKCLMKFCRIKVAGENCDFNRECTSGSCDANGKCTKQTLWQGLDAGKDESFGDDPNTNNLIAIATMLIILFAIIGGGRGNLISGVIGYIAFFAVGMFFASVGWLSGWIFLILTLMGIIGVVIIIILRTHGD